MCTVTYLPLKDRLLITSNRDEQTLREPAAVPATYDFKTGGILFPKDGRAGGTWIAAHSNGNAMVLLNGAIKRHIPHPPYRKSRGLIFLDIFDSPYPRSTFDNIALDDIEPFTLIIWENGLLWEAKWDGAAKYIAALATNVPGIWSSVTLYDPEVRALREAWFAQWLKERDHIAPEDIRLFHEFGGNGDETISFRMNRNGLLRTVSITAIELEPGKATMFYKDMNTGQTALSELPTQGHNL
jgi:Transport and Golgi organisation 2